MTFIVSFNITIDCAGRDERVNKANVCENVCIVEFITGLTGSVANIYQNQSYSKYLWYRYRKRTKVLEWWLEIRPKMIKSGGKQSEISMGDLLWFILRVKRSTSGHNRWNQSSKTRNSLISNWNLNRFQTSFILKYFIGINQYYRLLIWHIWFNINFSSHIQTRRENMKHHF